MQYRSIKPKVDSLKKQNKQMSVKIDQEKRENINKNYYEWRQYMTEKVELWKQQKAYYQWRYANNFENLNEIPRKISYQNWPKNSSLQWKPDSDFTDECYQNFK